MNYIANVTLDRILNQHSYPNIYETKPVNNQYLETNVNKEMLNRYFRSEDFAWYFYLVGPKTLIINHSLTFNDNLPFKFEYYFK